MIVRNIDGTIYGDVAIDEEDAQRIAAKQRCLHLCISVQMDRFLTRLITCDQCGEVLAVHQSGPRIY